MKYELSLVLSPEEAADEKQVKSAAAKKLSLSEEEITFCVAQKRSIDARSKNVKINISLQIYTGADQPADQVFEYQYQHVEHKKKVIIVGFGPAGMFAALKLLELGIKPVIIERGKNVRERRRDLAAINKKQLVDPNSNYCFGEGGAGTYSDGKLYTRSTKRGNVKSILEQLVTHGASKDILVDSHPHIGTNKLPVVVTNIRETILKHGGEIYFNNRMCDLLMNGDMINGVIAENTLTGNKTEILGEALILATGHSSRDVFELLHKKNVLIESKSFAMGVRIEHPQELIDSIQYHCKFRGAYLPPASYSLVHQAFGRGVYSFCMCPGGIIAPCSTAPGEVVTNGWSPSKRNNPYANSGIVVEIKPEDLDATDVFSGLRFQQKLEQMAFAAGGSTLAAPAQRMIDFVENRLSASLHTTSYQPGIHSAPLHELLPSSISSPLQQGFREFGKKMKGFYTNEAIIHAVESRTSSPIRIPRDRDTLEHIQIKRLYPCGEGAGYAGGIVSAAIDGQLCAEAIAKEIT